MAAEYKYDYGGIVIKKPRLFSNEKPGLLVALISLI